MRYDVCVAVISDLPFDARVWKEVRSLARSGRRVALIGCRYGVDAPRTRVELGVTVTELPFGWRDRPKSIRVRLRAVAGVWAKVLLTSARAYHAHNVHTAIPAFLAARLRRAKLVYDAHELYGVREGVGMRAIASARASLLVERFIVRRADIVITTNESRAEVLRNRHGDRKIVVLANVPPLVAELQPADPGYPSGVPVLLYQGWINPEMRAFRETIQALKFVPNLHFAILGFGHDKRRELIRVWASEEGVSDRVHLFPPRPFDELVNTAAAATIGLVPIKPFNLNQELGDTNKLHEYLMAGIPVVASDLPEIARVARQGDPPVGELFDPFSPESIAGAVRRVLADPQVYEGRCREARRLAKEVHNWECEETKLLQAYDGFSMKRNPLSETGA
jgi:glycosyltransferase involved in cell wall biosynthesis